MVSCSITDSVIHIEAEIYRFSVEGSTSKVHGLWPWWWSWPCEHAYRQGLPPYPCHSTRPTKHDRSSKTELEGKCTCDYRCRTCGICSRRFSGTRPGSRLRLYLCKLLYTIGNIVTIIWFDLTDRWRMLCTFLFILFFTSFLFRHHTSHNWSDANADIILSNIRKTMKYTSRLLLREFPQIYWRYTNLTLAIIEEFVIQHVSDDSQSEGDQDIAITKASYSRRLMFVLKLIEKWFRHRSHCSRTLESGRWYHIIWTLQCVAILMSSPSYWQIS